MPEGSTTAEHIAWLEQIFADQRTILSRYINPDVSKVPQVFIPYYEVLSLYDAGCKVPDDVIICWPDDSYGYIRRLPTAAEQQRSGGSGVYFHLQWCDGVSDAWSWLFSTPLGLVWEEMHKAYEYNARTLWIVYVGDIKPYEIGIEYFMKLAWNVNPWSGQNTRQYLIQWATRDFGAQYASSIADIVQKHGELGMQRRPEHMVWDYSTPANFIRFNQYNYNDEAQTRADAYADLAAKTDAIYNQLPTELKDAFFEMVSFNVKCAAYHNQRVIYVGKNYTYGKEKRVSVKDYGSLANDYVAKLNSVISHYNTGLIKANSKWNYMGSMPGSGGYNELQVMPPLSTYSGSGAATLQAALEGGDTNQLPDFSVYTKNKRFIDLYNSGTGAITWSSSVSPSCITLSDTAGQITTEKRLWVTIDWAAAPKGEKQTGTITFTGAGKTIPITVSIFNPASPLPGEIKGFVESHGYVCIEAEHYSRRIDKDRAAWSIITDLGRSGNAVTVLPSTVGSQTTAANILANSPSLEYDFYVFTPGTNLLTIYFVPTFPANRERGKLFPRVAIAIDNASPTIFDPPWGTRDPMSNLTKYTVPLTIATRGQHVLKVFMVDAGAVLDRIVLSNSKLLDSYLGPPESFVNQVNAEVDPNVWTTKRRN
jgi:hypothetical protein